MKIIITKDDALEAWNNPETKALFKIVFGKELLKLGGAVAE